MTAAGGDAKAWYLVYTKPRQEGVAQANLERQGYPVYLPRVKQRRRRAGRVTDVVEPLFPRYLFIQLSTQTDNWGPIRSTLGVSSLVRFGSDPAVVPEALVAALHARGDETGLQTLELPDFEPGQGVLIQGGPMQGYEGIFLVRTSRDRVTLLLDILGKQVRVSIGPEDVESFQK
jgi:transcriptional antiterminator RfaH